MVDVVALTQNLLIIDNKEQGLCFQINECNKFLTVEFDLF